ncbi:DedA family protein [Rhodoblastus sp.]|jgi:membrane protein DedA with SNARE-associated domain|uniref:DedA family protein n=1 Tax=Rhodoblastus sp. TaxID=1962975 RepID=UPI0025FDBB2F|nr:DedA family protein [Rhodoblastus sp.]
MFIETIKPLIAQHGYLAVFCIVALESAGIPLPGETALVLAAMFAGATGLIDIKLVIFFAALGAILGDNVGFWAGRRFGLPLLLNHGARLGLTDDRIKLGQYLFEHHGAKIVFFGRFIALLRIFAAFLAGVNRYSWGQFLFYNATGGIVWAVIFGLGGFAFGDAFERVAGPLGKIMLGLAALGVVLGWWIIHTQEKKLVARAVAAYPGPLRERAPAAEQQAAREEAAAGE